MIEFRILGPLELRGGDGREVRSVLTQPKRLALLAYLALAAPGYCHRDVLRALFWPESDEYRARKALNQALYVLRRALGEDAVDARGNTDVGLDPNRVWCDALAFTRLLAEDQLDEALEYYRGGLLAGFHLVGCAEFQRWMDSTREHFSRSAIEAALQVAGRQRAAGHRAGSAHWLRRAVRWAPFDEPLVRQLIQDLEQAGDRPGALREYEAFRSRLARELEVEPSVDLRREVERLRSAPPEHGRPVAVFAPPTPDFATSPPAQPTRRFPPRRLAVAVVGLLVVGAAIYQSANSHGTGNEVAPTAARIVVLNFDNLTGDTRLTPLGRIATDWIANGLARSGIVQILPPLEALRTEEEIGTGAESAWRRHLEIARRTRARLLVAGSYTRRSDTVTFQAQIVDPGTQAVVRAVSARALASDPLGGIETLHQVVAGALATVLDTPLARWMRAASQPPTLEAYHLYVDGMDLLIRNRWRDAARILERAASVDSSFAAPMLWAVHARFQYGDFPGADSLIRRVEPLSPRLPPWDRAMLDFLRGRLRGDQEAAYQAIRRVAALAPTSEWLYLLGAQAVMTNRPREAVRVLRGLDPEGNDLAARNTYRWLAESYHRLGDYEAALKTVNRARRQYPGVLPQVELRTLAALGRQAELERRLEEILAGRDPDWGTGTLLWDVGASLRLHRSPNARRVAERAVSWYRHASRAATADPVYQERLGQLLLLAEREDDAKTVFEKLHQDLPLRPFAGGGVPAPWLYLGGLGVMAARRGDRAEALRFAGLIDSLRGPYDFGEGTVWRAAIAAQLGDLQTGTALLRQALAEGLFVMGDLLTRPDLQPLLQHPPVQELFRPR